MKQWQRFPTFKQRGEWVELQFMAAAALRGYHVLKPWGDSLEYDVAIEHNGNLTRVQVKSTTVRNGTGCFCQFHRNYLAKKSYSIHDLDLFAAYVVPENVWYMIPAVVIRDSHAQSSRHSLPHDRPEKRPLPLRTLPRSLGPPGQNQPPTSPPRQALMK